MGLLSGFSPAGQTTTTSTSSPWSAQAPYLNTLFSGANNALGKYQNNPGSYIAPFNPFQTSAFNTTNQAAQGTNAAGNISGVNNSASNYTNNVLSGGMLNSNPGNSAFSQFASGAMQNNPYEQQQIQAATDPITRAYQTATAPGIASQMEAAGRYGSGAMANATTQAQDNLTQQLGNAVAPIVSNMYQTNQANQLTGAQGLSQNFNNAAQQQLGAAANAPNVVNSNLGTIGAQQNAGAQQQALQQQQNQSPFTLLNNYGSLIGGQYGSQGSASTPYYSNPLGTGLGLATAGAGLWNSATGGNQANGNPNTIGSAVTNGASNAWNWLSGGSSSSPQNWF